MTRQIGVFDSWAYFAKSIVFDGSFLLTSKFQGFTIRNAGNICIKQGIQFLFSNCYSKYCYCFEAQLSKYSNQELPFGIFPLPGQFYPIIQLKNKSISDVHFSFHFFISLVQHISSVQGAFLVFNHLNRLVYWIWCGFALIAYLDDCKLGNLILNSLNR